MTDRSLLILSGIMNIAIKMSSKEIKKWWLFGFRTNN